VSWVVQLDPSQEAPTSPTVPEKQGKYNIFHQGWIQPDLVGHQALVKVITGGSETLVSLYTCLTKKSAIAMKVVNSKIAKLFCSHDNFGYLVKYRYIDPVLGLIQN
jgi:hypothetical protein